MREAASGDKPRLSSWREWLRIYVCGLCMGCADIVPGISAGTVAFLLGIYEKLLSSIRSFDLVAIRAFFSLKLGTFFERVAWEFLLALALGIGTTFAALSRVVNELLGHPLYRTYLYALFVGLVLGAASFVARRLKNWQPRHLALFVCGSIAAFTVVFFMQTATNDEPAYDIKLQLKQPVIAQETPLANYNRATEMLMRVPQSVLSVMLAKGVVTPETEVYSHTQKKVGSADQFVTRSHGIGIEWWLVVCGMIGVCAMLLPGISGSYMLTILGAYPIAISALADLVNGVAHLHIDFDALLTLGSIFFGMLIGAALFSRLLGWLLGHYHDLTIATLTGFMLGALPAVWPFWSYEYVLSPTQPSKGPQLHVLQRILPDFGSSTFWIAVVCAIVGFIIVLLLERVSHRQKMDVMD